MENRQQQILSEIQSMMTSIRNQFNLLDAKISEFQQCVAAEDEQETIDLEPIEFISLATELEVAEEEVAIEEEPVAEPEVADDLPEDDDLPFFDEPETVVEEAAPVLEPVVEPVAEPVVEPRAEPIVELVAETVVDPVVETAAEPVVKSAPIIDTMTDMQSWRTDMPGSPVKDVRSAISLNDRILFINKLFDEDPMAFQEAIGKVNSFETFAQVVEYISTEHSDWNLESDTVYRFMMAVRRKVR
jgi:hypothetical protein